MIKIELIDIQPTNKTTNKWGVYSGENIKVYKSIYGKEINLTINEAYNIMTLEKFKESKQFLINSFEYDKQEKVRIDNVEWDIIRVKNSPKNKRKLLLVVVRK